MDAKSYTSAARSSNSSVAASPAIPSQTAQKPLMTILGWRPVRKGALLGFFSCELASGLILHGCTLNVGRNGQKWIGLPSRPYELNNEKRWQRLVDFVDPGKYRQFQAGALAALAVWFEEHPEQSTERAEQGDPDDDILF